VPALSLKDAADLSTLAAMCPLPFQRKELRHGLREVAYSLDKIGYALAIQASLIAFGLHYLSATEERRAGTQWNAPRFS